MSAETARSSAVRLPEINVGTIYDGKYKDRRPELKAAGKLTATGESAQNCLKPPDKRPTSPEAIRRFRDTLRPEAGKITVFYGKAHDPHLQWAKEMRHGVNTKPSMFAGELVNPDPKTRFKQKVNEKKESLYASHARGPLGSSHNQRERLPTDLDPQSFTFGIQTEKDITAGELVSPNKSYNVVQAEGEEGRDLYRKTHHAFKVSEALNRNYVSPDYCSTDKFGVPTPHDNDGRHVRDTLKWLHDTNTEKAAQVVNKRVDDFRERTQPQLGKVHDPIKDTLKVGPDHTFGIMVKPDEYGAGDLMHARSPTNYLRGKERTRGVLAAIRQHLKKANYHNFHDLLHAFQHYDKNGSGKVDINELREVCVQFNLPVDAVLLEQLMDYCDVDRDGYINYIEFSNFLNWKDKMPTGQPEVIQSHPGTPKLVKEKDLVAKSPTSRESTPRRIQKQIDAAMVDHRTSASLINATVGGISTKDYRTYGVPTIRTDKAAPRIRRVCDRTNYGDESDAFGLVNPSIFSTRGLSEKDFLRARPKEEIRQVFTNIGVHMTLDDFDKIYDQAASFDPRGQVSIELFRSVLDQNEAGRIIVE